jgi:bifunctional N-acetylglucosamine-1-phosphate-uridyltransferase/glucosamine-1-phosphate-acetyltransferase GlmU-like protein
MSRPVSHSSPSGVATLDTSGIVTAESETKVSGVNVTLIVAAAGRGSRMGGEVPKALSQVGDQFLIEISTRKLVEAAQTVVVVVSPTQRAFFEERLPRLHGIPVTYVEQSVPNGTTGAVLAGLESANTEWSIVVWADHVGAKFFDVNWLVAGTSHSCSEICLPLVERPNPYVYFDLDENGRLCGFHETRKNASKVSRGLSDCGTFLLRTEPIRRAIRDSVDPSLEDQNFLSLIPQFVSSGISVDAPILTNPNLAVGVNTPLELTEAHSILTENQ